MGDIFILYVYECFDEYIELAYGNHIVPPHCVLILNIVYTNYVIHKLNIEVTVTI